MKKKINIGLIIIIIIVYGGIGYKYFGQQKSDPKAISPLHINDTPKIYEIDEPEKKFTLTPSTRDPFLDKNYTNNNSITPISTETKKLKIDRKTIDMNWPVINYLGFTKSSNQTRKTAVLKINGKLYRKREGSTIDYISIIKIEGDSICLILNKKEKKYFYKNN